MTNDKTVNNGDNNTINTKANNLSIIVFLIYLLILPTFGVGIDYIESLIFYSIPPLIILNIFFSKLSIKFSISLKGIFFQISLITLLIISTIYSINPGMSYYFFWNFMVVLLIINLGNLLIHDSIKLSKFIIYFSLLYSIIFFLQKFNIIHIATKDYGDNFISQIFGHSYLGNFLFFPVIIILNNFKKNNKTSSIILLIFFLISLYLSNSRSAIFGLIIGLFFIDFYHKKIIFLTLFTLLFLLQFQSSIPNQILKSFDGSRPEYFRQGIQGFLKSPIIGNGPNTFDVINRQNLLINNIITNTTHNCILDFLTNNGIIFTSILFYLIFTGLFYQYKNNRLFFGLGLASLSSSLIDSFWGNPGILSISLLFILFHHPLLYSPTLKYNQISKIFLIIFSMSIIIFFLSKTISDYLFFTNKYELSLAVDPFNLNSRIKLLNNLKYLPSTLKLFKNEELIFQQLINSTNLPKNEQYYYHLFQINPKTNINYYLNISNYYLEQNNQTKLIEILNKIDKIANLQNTLPIAKIYYHLAISQWQNNNHTLAINNLENAVKYSYGWSHFYIELANAYWHNGEIQKAKDQLQISCSKSPLSIPHCQQYLNQNYFLVPGDPVFVKSIDSINLL